MHICQVGGHEIKTHLHTSSGVDDQPPWLIIDGRTHLNFLLFDVRLLALCIVIFAAVFLPFVKQVYSDYDVTKAEFENYMKSRSTAYCTYGMLLLQKLVRESDFAIVTKKSESPYYFYGKDQYKSFPCTGTIIPITVHQVVKRQIDENIQDDLIYLNTTTCGVGFEHKLLKRFNANLEEVEADIFRYKMQCLNKIELSNNNSDCWDFLELLLQQSGFHI
ncbi:hypothetical protein ACTXT7_007625 [Hymenolepis weldensis]